MDKIDEKIEEFVSSINQLIEPGISPVDNVLKEIADISYKSGLTQTQIDKLTSAMSYLAGENSENAKCLKRLAQLLYAVEKKGMKGGSPVGALASDYSANGTSHVESTYGNLSQQVQSGGVIVPLNTPGATPVLSKMVGGSSGPVGALASDYSANGTSHVESTYGNLAQQVQSGGVIVPLNTPGATPVMAKLVGGGRTRKSRRSSMSGIAVPAGVFGAGLLLAKRRKNHGKKSRRHRRR